MARNLIVHILGDATQLTRSFNQSTTAANAFGAQVSGSMGKAEKGVASLQKVAAGGFIGAAALTAGVAAIQETTQAASDLAEQMSKNRVVFGTSADTVVKFSETAASALGVSQTAALEATGTFGNLFSAIGIIGPQAATISTQFVKLASDMASFNNASPEDVLLALRSGLTGEVEPLRRYGVLLSEARVQQEAMAKSGKTSVKELTNQDKALARIAIIMRDTATAQGDFARTSTGLANQQRILAAQVQDLKTGIGTALLPAVLSITSALVEATQVASGLGKPLAALADIKIPTIVIPFALTKVEVGGGTAGSVVAKGAGLGFLGMLSPATLFAVIVKRAIDEIRGEPPPDRAIANLAAAFDEKFATFTTQAVGAVEKAVTGAAKDVPSFGEKGFKTAVNEVGESLQRAFQAALDALDLRFDKAVFAENTAGALAILAEIEKAIRKRIETEGRTTELLRLLFQVEQDRAAVIAGAKADKQAKADKIAQDRKDAAAAIIEAFEFGVTAAQLTPALNDDIKAMRVLKAGLEKQIREGTNVVENQRKLVVLEDTIADTEKQRTANQKAAAQSALERQQFRKLGVGPGGDPFTPGIKNLRKQFAQLSQNPELKDAPKKLQNQMKLVAKALMDPNLTPAVKKWINDLFATIRGTFNQEQKGPLTKTTSLNVNRLLDGLGLGPEAERLARSRLSRINSAGVSLAGSRTRSTGNFVTPGQQPIVVHTTVNLDGDVVGRNVTKTQQKGKRRNPTQKRGPNSWL